MKKENVKKALIMASALALSAQIVLPTAIFAESDTDAASVEQSETAVRTEEKDFPDDILFIGSSDLGEDTDKTSVGCISFGVQGERKGKFGKPDGMPPEKPDADGENRTNLHGEPPIKPNGQTETAQKPDGMPPEKPGDTAESDSDRKPPVNPNDEVRFGLFPDTEPPEKPDDEKIGETHIEIAKGDIIRITASDGTILETVTADKDAKGVVFFSDELVTDETYTLSVNDNAVATAVLPERQDDENDMTVKAEQDENQPKIPRRFGQNPEKNQSGTDEKSNTPPFGSGRQNMSFMNRDFDMRRI